VTTRPDTWYQRVSRSWALPIAVVLAAIAASVGGALSQPMWGDEVASARVLSEPNVSDVLQHVRRTESTPPAWYVLGWSVSKADDALALGALSSPVERLRVLSVLFATAASLLTALWARRLLGDQILGALAGLLVALGSTPAAYAGQLRAYALLMLLSVTFGLLLVEVSARPGISSWSWLGLALSVWLGTMTHYFFFFTVVAGGVWLWASRPQPPGRRATTLALALGLLAFLPWLPAFLEQLQHGRYRWIGGFDPRAVAALPGSLFFGPDGVFYGFARIALTVALVVGSVVLWKRPGGSAVVALGLLPIAGATVIWALGQPIFDERNMIGAAPFLAIVIAASVHALPKQLVTPIALASIAAAIIGATLVPGNLGRIAYGDIAQALVGLGWTADDPIVVDSPRARTSLRIAVAWYLPDHPTLTRAQAPRTHECSPLFVVGHSSIFASWVTRHRRSVEDLRWFASYDHPFSGRENGQILVARLRAPADLPGDAFYVRSRATKCRGETRTPPPS